MMRFKVLTLHLEGIVQAEAVGHPTDVIEAFRNVCNLLLQDMGPWRITHVNGKCDPSAIMDSDMTWELIARTKT